MPYIVAEESFPTKSAITERARAILARTPDGQPTTEVDSDFLLALFLHHDEWCEKSSGGVRKITTQTTVHGTRCFILCKHDDETIDISFPHAIRLMESTRTVDLLPQRLRDFRNAARSAVRIQIYDFRNRALGGVLNCPITGEQLSRDNAAVDHTPPLTFDQLLFTFCQEHCINPLKISVASEGGVVPAFEDTDLRDRWQAFHQARAALRLTSRIGNLQLPKSRLQWSELSV